ncbi:MAG: type II toxin-antitoxin system RelB/DinJ family antitoxin [Synergistaceae bacterium]|nr:type II toxin-antitoxin system RelB/DinJ family antitoxin [Synergistaceae bacterium]
MSKQAILQVSIDADLKQQVEDLYKRLGTSFAEAVRIFARQSIEENAMPFNIRVPISKRKRTLGIADGKFRIPDDFDKHNDEIASMFGIE